MNSSPLQSNHKGAVLTKLPTGKWYRYWKTPAGKTVRQYFFEIKCSQCGSSTFTSATRDRRTKHSFCTHDCKNKFLAGANHPGWKGGFVKQAGHRYIRVDGHPKSSKGYIAEHIIVAEKKLGRYLSKGEMVHHIDCDKLNNEPSNLVVLTQSKHSSAHQSVNGILKGLIGAGIVWFDEQQNKYKSKYGEIEVYERDENIRQREWRKQWALINGRAYGKARRGPICSVATSGSKPLGQVQLGPEVHSSSAGASRADADSQP